MNNKQHNPQAPDLSDFAEEAVPFDDVMRHLMKAKPEPKKALPEAKAKAKKAKKAAD